MISAKFSIGPFASEISLLNVPVGRAIRRLKSKKGRLILATIARNIYCKTCAALYKENWEAVCKFSVENRVENGDIRAGETANNQSESR